MRIALFGGSFDPPHMAHVMAISVALASGEVDRVLVVPCFQHVLGKQSTSFAHRFAMAQRAFGLFGNRVELSDMEATRGGPSRTLDTLEDLRAERPDDTFRLLIGTDILGETDQWYRFDEVARLAPPLVLGRSGHKGPSDTAYDIPAIASSDIRQQIGSGQLVGHLVPASVLDYIAQEGLYGYAP